MRNGDALSSDFVMCCYMRGIQRGDMPVTDHELPTLERTISGRESMRSVADALEALRQTQKLPQGHGAQILTIPIGLPTGQATFIVLIVAQPLASEPAWGVALPSSNSFTARDPSRNLVTFEITRLDRAWIDVEATVKLLDGSRLRAVNVVPTRLSYELTPLQKRIVYWTIKFIDAEARCYRGAPSPDLGFLDYGKLHGLKLPSLKAIARYIGDQDSKLRAISHQTIANALAACGLRRRSERRAA